MIIRVHKTKDYTVMSNSHLRECGLSLKAKGLMSLMLSLPEDWDYSVKGLQTLSKDGRDSITAAIRELESAGYLTRTMAHDGRGKFNGYDYDLYEQPFTEKPSTDKPITENPQQSIIEEINKEKQIDKRDRTDKRAWPHPLTDRLIESGYVREDDPEIDEYDEWFRNASFEGYDYKTLRSATWYLIDHFKLTDGKDEMGNPIRDRLSYLKTSLKKGAERLKKEEGNIL